MTEDSPRSLSLSAAVTLPAAVAICFLPAVVASWFPPGEWYAQLQKPSWTPPDWVFAPAWTTLYLTMGVSLWLLWRSSESRARGPAYALFLLQLALNASWSWLFFGLQSPRLALYGIVLLWGVLAATIIVFWRHSVAAGVLLLPYFGWVAFAKCLNFEILQLNS